MNLTRKELIIRWLVVFALGTVLFGPALGFMVATLNAAISVVIQRFGLRRFTLVRIVF